MPSIMAFDHFWLPMSSLSSLGCSVSVILGGPDFHDVHVTRQQVQFVFVCLPCGAYVHLLFLTIRGYGSCRMLAE